MLLQVLTDSGNSLKCLVKQINLNCTNGCVSDGVNKFSAYSIPIPDAVLLSGEQAYFDYIAGNFPQFYNEYGKSALLSNPNLFMLELERHGWNKRIRLQDKTGRVDISTTVTYRDIIKSLYDHSGRVKTY